MTVGETLSHARRSRGMSVDDVAADTRIRATLIHAIEDDHFEKCGGAVYVRGHIRSIARVVGVDPEPLLDDLDGVPRAPAPAKVVAAVTNQPSDRLIGERSERRRPNWTIATAAALVLICAIALVAGLSERHHGNHKQQLAQGGGQSAAGRQSPSVTPTPTSVRPPSGGSLAPLAAKATMLVRTRHGGQTWLQVTTKTGNKLFEGLLSAGEHKTFANRRGLAYVIGNAPAVDVVVNGNDIGSPPSTGVVARGHVKPGASTVHNA